MSYRCCAKCDWVVDNTCCKGNSCPHCGSEEWACPVEDDRRWEDMYKKQIEELLKED